MRVQRAIEQIKNRLETIRRIHISILLFAVCTYVLLLSLLFSLNLPFSLALLIVSVSITIAIIKAKKILQPPDIYQAALFLDGSFKTKERVVTLCELLDKKEIKPEEQQKKELLLRQLEGKITDFDPARLLPLRFSKQKKALLLSLLPAWGLIIYLSSAVGNFTNAPPEAREILKLLKETKTLSDPLRSDLQRLADNLTNRPLDSEKVQAALEAAEQELLKEQQSLAATENPENALARDDTILKSRQFSLSDTPIPTPADSEHLKPDQQKDQQQEQQPQNTSQKQNDSEKSESHDERKNQQQKKKSQQSESKKSKGGSKDQKQSKSQQGQQGKEKSDQSDKNSRASQGNSGGGKGSGQQGEGKKQSSAEKNSAGKKSSENAGGKGSAGQNTAKQEQLKGKQGGKSGRQDNQERQNKEEGKSGEQSQATTKQHDSNKSKTKGNKQENSGNQSKKSEELNRAARTLEKVKKKLEKSRNSQQKSTGQPKAQTSAEQNKQGADKKGNGQQKGDNTTKSSKEPEKPKGEKNKSSAEAKQQGRKDSDENNSAEKDANPNNSSLAKPGEKADRIRLSDKGKETNLPGKGFKEKRIPGNKESLDLRFTGKESKLERNKGVAKYRRRIENIELAKPEKEEGNISQPIPLEYSDILE